MMVAMEGFVSAKANLRAAQVKARSAGRRHNEARTRQAIRGIKEMFRKDGLL
jgi:hypothetical protein